MSDEYFEYFLTKFPLAVAGPVCTHRHVDTYRDLLPSVLLSYWEESGFSGFGNGTVWLVDPLEWEPTVQDAFRGALRHPQLPEDARYIPFARGAFGKTWFWTPGYGISVTAEPADGTVFYSPLSRKRLNSDLDSSVRAFFSTRSGDRFDYLGKDATFIFDQVFDRLGLLRSDQMYGFSPPVRNGGIADADNAEVLPIHTHLVQLTTASLATGGWNAFIA